MTVVGPAELGALLGTLLDAGVDFILVGGGAAVIHGAPVTTQDVDIVHDREPHNVQRLPAWVDSTFWALCTTVEFTRTSSRPVTRWTSMAVACGSSISAR